MSKMEYIWPGDCIVKKDLNSKTKSLLIIFHKQDRNSSDALVFAKKHLWLSRLLQ